MNKKIVIFILILLSSLFISLGNCDIYSSWNNYKILTFSYGYSGLQVNFNVTYGTGNNGLNYNCKEDFSDLRFVDYTTGYLLSAYNQTTINKNYCNIWLKLGESQQVIMYYNNPEALPYWNIYNTFNDVIGNVVLALPMDEGSGTVAYDYSGNKNNGTIANGSWDGDDLVFNGVSTKVTVGSQLNISGYSGLTVFARFCPYSFPASNWLHVVSFTEYTGFCLAIDSGNGVRVLLYNSSAYGYDVSKTAIGLAVNHNYDMALVGSIGDKPKSYVNASLQKEHIYLLSDFSKILDYVTVGAVSARFFNGTISDVFLFNNCVSDASIGNLNDYHVDPKIVEGSVCCRVWDLNYQDIVYGSEVSSQSQDAILIGIFALIIGFCALLFVLIKKK